MDDDWVILCSEAQQHRSVNSKTICLDLAQGKGNVKLKIQKISERLVTNIPSLFWDLLDIATYVYCADQAVGRGGKKMPHLGEKWRRSFEFRIPVRQVEVWESDQVKNALEHLLSFLSEDEYLFNFTKLHNPPPFQQYLEIPTARIFFDVLDSSRK